MAYATLRRHLVLVCPGWIDADALKSSLLPVLDQIVLYLAVRLLGFSYNGLSFALRSLLLWLISCVLSR